MSNDYERLLRDYNVPYGVLSPEELKMLQEGGIRLDDSDNEAEDHHHIPLHETHTQPKYPRVRPQYENESLRQVY